MEATAVASNSMDDIQYLLHLDSIKRYTDEEKDVQRQVEDQMRIYQEAKREYQREYARLANFNKQVLLCEALQAPQTQINDCHVDDTIEKLRKSSAILSSRKRPTELDARALEECRKQLEQQHSQPRQQLAQQHGNFTENRDTLRQVCGTLDSVENNFETATLLAVEQYTKQLQAP
ncbi:hypothetical protein KR093_010582 [Drosophila rubida]|uniref:Augmin complex subunit dgt4 n=1 Tax=Drosophila rubida TaxID=30044 RepID=A0AAD4KBQ0_9MUSC|nr:hypothetical protein KR093_010582 [Drosophila rubida]